MKVSRKIVGVDPGYVNLGVCGLKTNQPKQPYHWSNTPLFKGEFSEEKLCAAVYAWINQPHVKQLFDEADEIVLERQMTMKFQAINHCIRFKYFAKTREVNPNTLRAFFGLPAKRREKKKAAVELVRNNTVFPLVKGKKDDLADAYLLAFYGALESQPELGNDWTGELRAKKRKTIDLV